MADVDRLYSDADLAALYDPLDPDRRDLDVYVDLVKEFDACSVLDIGCGTGTFACLLASQGHNVIALDPANASLDVARRKSDADKVRWIEGDSTALPPLQVDLVTMTGNVGQVFLTDEEFMSVLRSSRVALRPGGRLVFEVRDPAKKAWLDWTREKSYKRVDLPEVGFLETWVEMTAVREPFVSFLSTFAFGSGRVITSESTLRFRTEDEVRNLLQAADLFVEEVRGASDRPGRELIFISKKEGQ